MVSSIRSKQTGHVGSSINDGVGGARGFVESGAAARVLGWGDVEDTPGRCTEVVGKEACCPGDFEPCSSGSTPWISTDLTKTTWHVSGYTNSQYKNQHIREAEHTSILLKTFPFHSFCHSLAFFPLLNFINTIYRFARAVRIMRK